jgi:hypothetical protein
LDEAEKTIISKRLFFPNILNQYAFMGDLVIQLLEYRCKRVCKKALIKSFDRLRADGNLLISFVASLSIPLLSKAEGHERN